MENQAFSHCGSLIDALGTAMTRCVVWRYADSDEKYNALQLYRFAKDFDRENPVSDGSFYMVSAEGAIGVSPGAEHLTRWVFIPSMDEESIEKLRADIQHLQDPEPEPAPAPAPEPEPAPAPEPEPAPAPEPEPPVRRSRFCPNCGTPYKNDDSKFCSNCGTPREA